MVITNNHFDEEKSVLKDQLESKSQVQDNNEALESFTSGIDKQETGDTLTKVEELSH